MAKIIMMETISWKDFEKIELRVGEIIEVREFPEANKPAYKLKIDFGKEFGIKNSSAQITQNYKPQDLLGKKIIAVTNFSPKQIGPFISECLVTGFEDEKGGIVLAIPEKAIPLGRKLL